MALTGVDLRDMRKPYRGEQHSFGIDDLISKEPYANFKAWFELARNSPAIYEANAMSLATCGRDMKPSVRTVLLKGFDENGFKFYTNYESRKGREMEQNSHASLLFYWTNKGSDEENTWSHQVRVEGTLEKLSEEESTEYFVSRPRSSQISASISPQSQVIPNKEVLKEKKRAMEEEYADENKVIPKPSFWGGYLLKPDWFEFWQGQTTRLHDRIVFRKLSPEEQPDTEVTCEGENGWYIERLAP